MNCLKCPKCGSTRFSVEFQEDGQLRTEFPRGDGFFCSRCHCFVGDSDGRPATKPKDVVAVIDAGAGDQKQRARIAFWKWKADLMNRVLSHPAMQEDAECVVHFNLDSPTLRDSFNAGKTVEQVFAEIDEKFNVWGC